MNQFLSITLAVFLALPLVAQKTSLKFDLKEGETYHQKTNAQVEIEQDLDGYEFNMSMTVKGSVAFKIKESIQNAYMMDARYEQIGMAMQSPQGSFEFSSDSDAEDVMTQVFKGFINNEFEMKMDKHGKIMEVNHLEELWGKSIDQFNLTEAQSVQIKSQINQAYGPDAMKGSMEMVTAIFPDKPVSIGDTWKIVTQLESGMSAQIATTYEFIGFDSGFALIQGTGQMVTADKDAYVENNGMEVRYNLNGTTTSNIKVDQETGWIAEAIIIQDLSGDYFIKPNEQFPNGMTVPMKMKSTNRITR